MGKATCRYGPGWKLGACALAAFLPSACVGYSPVGPNVGRTAMLYLPATRPGQPGTTLPYAISAGRQERSLAYLALQRAEVTPATAPAAVDAGQRCSDRQDCGSTSAHPEWLSASPAEVISSALTLAHDGDSVTRASLQKALVAGSHSAGSRPATGIRVESYDCRANWDRVPTDLLAAACHGRRAVQKVIIGGEPGILEAGRPRAGDAAFSDRFWYRLDQLRADAVRLGLSLDDVSPAYEGKAAYDLPPTTIEYQVGDSAGRLIVAVVGAGRNPAGPKTDVISISIYQPKADQE